MSPRYLPAEILAALNRLCDETSLTAAEIDDRLNLRGLGCASRTTRWYVSKRRAKQGRKGRRGRPRPRENQREAIAAAVLALLHVVCLPDDVPDVIQRMARLRAAGGR